MQFQPLYEAHVLPTYGRYPVSFAKGKGSRLWDAEGKEYIDFMSGIGVNAVGHSHPQWVAAVADQAALLAHTSNLYMTRPGAELAQRLCQISGMARVFFANSGAEANEGMFKVARKYSSTKYNTQARGTILSLAQSFHGRTMATLTATGQPDKFHHSFYPFPAGYRHVPAGDVSALEAQGDDVCALLIEPIQGEGGVQPLDAAYVKAAAEICRQRDWLLLVDEVQTGMGRTGEWFGFQHFDITPSVISFAKGIAGGLPMGGFMVSEALASVLGPGDHGTTFGGNLICAAAALATLDILTPVLPSVSQKGEAIRNRILAMNIPAVADVRGKGLMLGVQLNEGTSPAEVNAALLQNGLAGLTAGTDILRFMPPLTIAQADIDAGLEIFEQTMKARPQ